MPVMSYHARIGMPPLIVTGRTGACGKTNRSAGQVRSTSSGTIGSKSCPSAPSPCSQITACCGFGAVSISTQGKDIDGARQEDLDDVAASPPHAPVGAVLTCDFR